MDIWQELGITPTSDEREIKRAYARRLRVVHPEDDAEGFQILRQAFELALSQVQSPAFTPSEIVAPEAQAHSAQTQVLNGADDVDSQPSAIDGIPDERPLVAHAVESFLDTVGNEPEVAATTLKAILRRPEFENLAAKEHFEFALLFALYQQEDIRPNVIAAVASELRWDQDCTHLLRANPAVTQRVLARARASHFLNELAAAAKNGHKSAQLLLSPFDPKRYRWYAMKSRFVAEMARVLQIIRYDRPEVVQELDRRILEWWAAKTNRVNLYWWHLWFAFAAGIIIMFRAEDTTAPSLLCHAVGSDVTCRRFTPSMFLIAGALSGVGVALLFEMTKLYWRTKARIRVNEIMRLFVTKLYWSSDGQAPPKFRLHWIWASIFLFILNPPLYNHVRASEWVLVALTILVFLWMLGAAHQGRTIRSVLSAEMSANELASLGALATFIIGFGLYMSVFNGAFILSALTGALLLLFLAAASEPLAEFVSTSYGHRGRQIYKYAWLPFAAVMLFVIAHPGESFANEFGEPLQTSIALVAIWGNLTTRHYLSVGRWGFLILVSVSVVCIAYATINFTQAPGLAVTLGAWLITTIAFFAANHCEPYASPLVTLLIQKLKRTPKIEGAVTCPWCKLINHPSAKRCDCGYNFK